MDFQLFIVYFNIAMLSIIVSIVGTLHGNFYPSEAEKRGAVATEYGLVTGLFFLSSIITLSMSVWVTRKIRPIIMLIVSTLMLSMSVTSFGALEYIENKTVFIGISYVLRTVEGSAKSFAKLSIINILTFLRQGFNVVAETHI